MKIRTNSITKYFTVFLLLFVFFGFQQVVLAEGEFIESFNSQIVIQKDGLVSVVEDIVYNFGSNQKHGIFRDLPLSSSNGPQLSITVSAVKDKLGKSYKYSTSVSDNVLRIKIGDPDTFVSGVKTYSISYLVYNSIRTFDDHNELYWNVVGNDWGVGIGEASASVMLEESVSNISADCFTGFQGSKDKNCSFSQSGNGTKYKTTKLLSAGEGFTFVFGIPQGYVNNTATPPANAFTNNTSSTNKDFFLIFLPIFIFVFIFTSIFLLVKLGRRNKPRPVIPRELKNQALVVEYNPPSSLLPIEVGAILDRRVDIVDISSIIMDLAVRKYVKIRFWSDKKDFEILKLKNGSDLNHPAEKTMFSLLFNGRDGVNLSDLKKEKVIFQSDIKKIKKETEQGLRDGGYFDQSSGIKYKIIKNYLVATTLVLFVGFLVSSSFLNRFAFVFVFLSVVSIILFSVVFSGLKEKLTLKGTSTFAKILGFREFLELTEKDKLQALNAPDLKPEMFEKFLPYAMVLGVEDKWAKKFEGIYEVAPEWYEDTSGKGFNSQLLTSQLVAFNSSFNRVFNITSPQSSSGFGGGGFSGGGSGGGGGGSW